MSEQSDGYLEWLQDQGIDPGHRIIVGGRRLRTPSRLWLALWGWAKKRLGIVSPTKVLMYGGEAQKRFWEE